MRTTHAHGRMRTRAWTHTGARMRLSPCIIPAPNEMQLLKGPHRLSKRSIHRICKLDDEAVVAVNAKRIMRPEGH